MRRAVVLVLLAAGILFPDSPFSPAGAASSPADLPPGAAAIFHVERSVVLARDGAGPSIAAVGDGSVYVVGTFDRANGVVDDLLRVDDQTLRIVKSVRLPSETSVAFGDGHLWWATGALAFNQSAPDQGRALYELSPTTLAIERTFVLPGRTVLVAAAGHSLWVAERHGLVRISPDTGRVLAHGLPGDFVLAMVPSTSGRQLFVVASEGSHEFLIEVDAADGRRVASQELTGPTSYPPAEVAGRVWLTTFDSKTAKATLRGYSGSHLLSLEAHTGYRPGEVVYAGRGVVWAVDSGGLGRTQCVNPVTGAIEGRGPSIGVGYGSVDVFGGATFVLYQKGLVNELLKVAPTSRCS